MLHGQQNIKYIFFTRLYRDAVGQHNIKYISVLVLSTWLIDIPNIQNFNIKNLCVMTAS